MQGGGTSLVVQWLRIHNPNAGGLGSIPGQGIKAHIPRLKRSNQQLKILCASTETWHSQINKYTNIYK